jgi:hypothetical protein
MAKTGNESIDRTAVTTIGEEAGGLSVVRAVANGVARLVRPQKNEAAIEQQLQKKIKSHCLNGFAPEIDVEGIEDNTIIAKVRKLYRTELKEEKANLTAKVDSFGKVSEVKLEITNFEYKENWYETTMRAHFETALQNGKLSGRLFGKPKLVSMGSDRVVFMHLNIDEKKSVIQFIKFTFSFEKKPDIILDGFLTVVGQTGFKLSIFSELTIPFPYEKQIRSELKKSQKNLGDIFCDLTSRNVGRIRSLNFSLRPVKIDIQPDIDSISEKEIIFKVKCLFHFLHHASVCLCPCLREKEVNKEFVVFTNFHYSIEKKKLKFLKRGKWEQRTELKF